MSPFSPLYSRVIPVRVRPSAWALLLRSLVTRHLSLSRHLGRHRSPPLFSPSFLTPVESLQPFELTRTWRCLSGSAQLSIFIASCHSRTQCPARPTMLRLKTCISSASNSAILVCRFTSRLPAFLLTPHSERRDLPVLPDMIYDELQVTTSIRNVAHKCVQNPGRLRKHMSGASHTNLP